MAKRVITMKLSASSIRDAITELKSFRDSLEAKTKVFLEELANIGFKEASIRFTTAMYDGVNDSHVTLKPIEGGFCIVAEGNAVAFIEFGAGATYGYGHPQAGEFGVGPGTYPDGKGHWDNPKGWWFGSGQHTYGNPPAAAMWSAVQEIAENVTEIAKEVFRSTV